MGRPRKMEKGVFGPRKLADGRKAFDVRYRNERGENKSVTVYDLDEANGIARDKREGRYNEHLVPDTTLGEFFSRPQVAKTIRREHGLSDETAKRWREVWRRHICHPDYGIAGKPLKQLVKKAEFNDFINGMEEAEVGHPTQRRTLGIVSAILDEAVEQDLVTHNAIRLMKNKPSAGRRTDIYIPSIEFIERIRLDLLTCHYRARRREYRQRDALMISVMAYLAPRPEEFRGLSWEKSGKDSLVAEIIAEKAKRGKSKTLIRNPPVNEIVAAELEAWYQRLGCPGLHTPVIPLPRWAGRQGGEHWDAKSWADWRNRIFKPAVKRVAKEVARTEDEYKAMIRMRPYDLRHTGCSLWLANAGKNERGEWDGSPANPVDAAEWAGHDKRTMWDTYAHKIKTSPRVPIREQIEAARTKLGLDPVSGLSYLPQQPTQLAAAA
jgi:integrase